MQVGGEKAAAKAAEAYLKMLGKHVIHCGEQGNGQAAKVFFPRLKASHPTLLMYTAR